MHFTFYNEWYINKKIGNITFFRITWEIEKPYFTLEITLFNFTIQIDIG